MNFRGITLSLAVLWVGLIRLAESSGTWEDEWRKSGRDMKDAGFVMRGRKTILKCPGLKTSPVSPGEAEFLWFKGDDDAAANSRMTVTSQGELSIDDAQPDDSGPYTCQINDSAGAKVSSIKQNILVFEMPNYTYKVFFVYDVSTCEDTFGNEKVDEYKNSLCPESDTCQFSFEQTCRAMSGSNRALVIVVRVQVPKQTAVPDCDVHCMKKTVLKYLNQGYVVLKELAINEEKESTDGASFKKDKFQKEMIRGCPAGYEPFHQTVCLPCLPGTYSTEGAFECKQCLKNTYQPQFAMTDCFQCPKLGTTKEKGARYQADCSAPGTIDLHLEMPAADSNTGMVVGVVCAVLGVVFLVIAFTAYKVIGGPKKKNHKFSDVKISENSPSKPLLNQNSSSQQKFPSQVSQKASRLSRPSRQSSTWSRGPVRSAHSPARNWGSREQVPVYDYNQAQYQYPDQAAHYGYAPGYDVDENPRSPDRIPSPTRRGSRPTASENWNVNAVSRDTPSQVTTAAGSSTATLPQVRGRVYSKQQVNVSSELNTSTGSIDPQVRGKVYSTQQLNTISSGNKRHVPLSRRLSSHAELSPMKMSSNLLLQAKNSEIQTRQTRNSHDPFRSSVLSAMNNPSLPSEDGNIKQRLRRRLTSDPDDHRVPIPSSPSSSSSSSSSSGSSSTTSTSEDTSSNGSRSWTSCSSND